MPDNVRVNNVEVFRAGDYGDKGSYSNKDLKEIAARFSSGDHDPPVTIDHEPWGRAYGWVRNIFAKGRGLFADLDLHADFAEEIKNGLFAKRSILLRKDPLRLDHVTFLGAAPPAVKGMRNLKFSEVTFAEPEGESIVFGEDAELDGDIFQEEPTPEPEDREIPLKDADGNYNGVLVGRAIARFGPGGYGNDTEKIEPDDPRYYDLKHKIQMACNKLKRSPTWALWTFDDMVRHPVITVEALKAHRSDIIKQLTSELQEEIHMSDDAKKEMEAKEAELKEKTEECAAMSEELETLKAEKAKAKMSEELDAAIAKAELSEKGANEIKRQFAERDNLDGLQESIDGVKTLLEGMKFDGRRSINDNPPGAAEAGTDAAKMERADTITKKTGCSKGDAIRQAFRPEK